MQAKIQTNLPQTWGFLVMQAKFELILPQNLNVFWLCATTKEKFDDQMDVVLDWLCKPPPGGGKERWLMMLWLTMLTLHYC